MKKEKTESAYSQKLRDPRWQKMRLKIMERDEFTCRKCGDSESTLNVHHRYYIWGRDPWDYDECLLVTLCQLCHDEEHGYEDAAKDLVPVLKANGFFNTDISGLTVLIHSMKLNYPAEVFVSALDWMATDPALLDSFFRSYFAALRAKNEKAKNNG